ncbi:group 1 glycosyl transferase [Agromyces badenianii]|uniref:Group 1 glycosyl transferase n=1 Tax=Agromyces badenianii TaxID=2080742 RepID=A0A2S0WY77_9MICO|nr:glycosyltransferase family 4 protein [Agromyces badenianii]AWB96307.1 group 1 glycosyl transferase [Agromyces badenianii]PWC05172.1 group 1 glycosyl transferase [Agromyces badenianii]
MKILVHPHLMEVGGSQLNAIELADAVRRRGHEVVLYAPPGELVEEVHRRGLELILAPSTRRMTPSPASAARLVDLVRSRRFDVVHSYEWSATLDTMYGPGWMAGTPVVSTVLSMVVPKYIPASVPVVVGTNELYEAESKWRPEVYLMEPPIDVAANTPGIAPFVEHDGRTQTVRERWGIPSDETLIVLVGRLAQGLKLGGVLEAIRAMALLDERHRAHLLVVGDGPDREAVQALVDEVNASAPRRLVTLAGLMMDPRPAYDAADVVLGMGGSILRAMSFGKPVIVQGEAGFWSTLDAGTVETFRWQGWFGLGDGTDGAPELARLLDELIAHPADMARNGELGRRVVLDHYDIERAADELEQIYRRVAGRSHPMRERIRGSASMTMFLARIEAGRVVRGAKRRVRAIPLVDRFAPAPKPPTRVGPSWS